MWKNCIIGVTFADMRYWLLSLFCIYFSPLWSQQVSPESVVRKTLQAVRTQDAPQIDGMADVQWEAAPVGSGFVERDPVNGAPVSADMDTEVQVMYDDVFVYIYALMHDPEPQNIMRQLSERDEEPNADVFTVYINGFNDFQQSLVFGVTAAGVQIDGKWIDNQLDLRWNAVWWSAIEIHEQGWSVELRIPLAELRFPKRDLQTWGINFERQIRRIRTYHTWNFVDNNIENFSYFDGQLTGLQNIQTPLRLFFYPYASLYHNRFAGQNEWVPQGGMDIKYGISDAFTLDATLIPDFGQAAFDPVIYNLGPFEQQFQEQRPFFQEGVELFEKGDLFYSRRIGGPPITTPRPDAYQEVQYAPSHTELINAVKISGRTRNKLGIGVMNALARPAHAVLIDTISGVTVQQELQPLTNFNILSLDKRIGSNSSVSFMNTHTLRNPEYRNSNVSGVYWDLVNAANRWRFYGNVEWSHVYGAQQKDGTEIIGGVNKIDGNHRYGLSYVRRGLAYDIDDLGFTGANNYHAYYGSYSYRILQPRGGLNSMRLTGNLAYSRRNVPSLFEDFAVDFGAYLTNRRFHTLIANLYLKPLGHNHLYDARQWDRHIAHPASARTRVWLSTDYSRFFALDFTVSGQIFDEDKRGWYAVNVSPRFRFNNHWWLVAGAEVDQMFYDRGFATRTQDEIIVGRRNRLTWTKFINTQYSIDNTKIVSLNLRHYTSAVEYIDLWRLSEDGGMAATDFNENQDGTLNIWNLDVRFSWWFSPGSQLTFLYRSNANIFLNASETAYFQNLREVWEQPQRHSISLRLIYFLDYNRVRNWF
ncbi:MAG: DUF5916 domain-containing protein [Weeksellaceae bacterium]|nr:DUF5916 domain-containing protein [Weeksellaceae bacterium]